MKNYPLSISAILLLVVIFFLQGCVKDTCERQQKFTYYAPVYKTKAAVKAGIKSGAPIAISNPGKIFIIGNFIFLNEIDKGIHVIDNTNPASPKNISFITIPGNEDIAVSGNILYADVYTDMVALNIAAPSNVSVEKFIEGVFPFRAWSGGFIPDTNLVVVDFVKRDTTVTTSCNTGNVFVFPGVYYAANSSGTSATNISASPIGTAGSMARFALTNNRLYTVSNEDLNIFNVSSPQNPTYIKKVNISSWAVETIFPFQNKLFIGSSNGMSIYSLNNADNPLQSGQFAHVRTCDPVIADSKYAYVTLRSGTSCGGFTNQMDVLDIGDIYHPSLVKSYPLTNPHGLSKDKNLLFICDGADGLKVFDASTAGNIFLIKQITGIETYDVIAVNDTAIVIAADGLYQYSYADANNIQLLSKLTVEK